MEEKCASCGAVLPPNAAYCGACGEPVNWRDRIHLEGQMARVAPMGKRVLAFGIDIAVVFSIRATVNIVQAVAGLGLSGDSGHVSEYRACVRVATTVEARRECLDDFLPHLWQLILLSLVIPFAIAMTYWAVCNIRGVSVGKWAAGIRVVDARGRRPGIGRGLGRTFAAFFLSSPLLWLGYCWAFWQRQHRTWHDMIAGTYVVRVPPTGAESASHDPAMSAAPPAP